MHAWSCVAMDHCSPGIAGAIAGWFMLIQLFFNDWCKMLSWITRLCTGLCQEEWNVQHMRMFQNVSNYFPNSILMCFNLRILALQILTAWVQFSCLSHFGAKVMRRASEIQHLKGFNGQHAIAANKMSGLDDWTKIKHSWFNDDMMIYHDTHCIDILH